MQLRQLSAMAPLQRRLLLMAVDGLLLAFCVWLSFWLRLAHPFAPQVVTVGSWLVPAALLLGLPLYVLTGQYKGLSRYVGSRALYDLS
ncbi:MAG: polysaccharide biosynthesis protein, partial [Cyanobacteria bacterium K_DeepCast_0m_m1_088]|nr:polysaccharide biosynthesis protein [Cyanobacteria bacterium K_DeepCast_0m_m1_088]